MTPKARAVRQSPLAQVGPPAALALRFACRLMALRSAREQPVDYLDKLSSGPSTPIVATLGDQIWMSPEDQFWMSLDTGDRAVGSCQGTGTRRSRNRCLV